MTMTHMWISALVFSLSVEVSQVENETYGDSDSLFEVIASGDCSNIHNAIDNGAPIDDRDDIGATPLMRAVEANLNPKCVRRLLDKGADPNATHGDQNISVLMIAASYSTPEVISLLVHTGAEVRFSTPDGWTALMSAARNSSQPEVIETLVALGADVNVVDRHGVTALMRAAQSNLNPEVTLALLKLGADSEIASPNGHTALDLAREFNESPEVIEVLRSNWKTHSEDRQGDLR